mmetsp:Transcript_15677/g.37793  ORF Transcript_15677/g.37793 Transcript_15677/m.37793 type:complete len:92 (+) Transcript_15677:811-1086(+)
MHVSGHIVFCKVASVLCPRVFGSGMRQYGGICKGFGFDGDLCLLCFELAVHVDKCCRQWATWLYVAWLGISSDCPHLEHGQAGRIFLEAPP